MYVKKLCSISTENVIFVLHFVRIPYYRSFDSMAAAASISYPPFDCQEENVAVRWNRWVSRLRDNVFVAYEITDDLRKRALLLTLGGEELNDIYDAIPGVERNRREPHADHPDDTHFARTVAALTAHFNPRRNVEYQKYMFRKMKQGDDKAMVFYGRLRQAADACGFDDRHMEIKSQLITGARNEKVTKKGLAEPDATLDQLLNLMKTLEVTEEQNRLIHRPEEEINRVEKRPMQHRQNRKPKSKPDSNNCRNCGRKWPHDGGQQACPARGKECRKCGKSNHFAKFCKSQVQETKDRSDRPRRKPLHQVSANDSQSETEYVYSINGVGLPYTTVHIQDTEVRVLIDSGASINIIDESSFNHLKTKPQLHKSKAHIVAYGAQEAVQCLGTFSCRVRIGNAHTQAQFYVTRGSDGNLLGCETARALKAITINQVRIELEKHSKLFTGVGKLKDQTIKLHVDPSVSPTAIPHRRVPFHLRKKVEDKLAELEQEDIIEKVDGDAPTPWVSPIVTPPKPNNPSEIRLCVDMRGPNKAIQRARHITPTIEDVLSDLNGATRFSKLDLNQGYHQLELNPKSRSLTTFSTHVGLWQYKRLNFGISCASEIFQNEIRKVLNGLEGTLNVSDDILVYGRSDTEHNERLTRVLERLEQKGLTLNKNKCKFAKKSLTYLGYVFSEDGVAPDPNKVDDVRNAPRPTNVLELRSFLGLANYCSRFIQDFATITAPLRSLTRKDETWNWKSDHETAFKKLKKALTSSSVMSYFNPSWQTEILVDGSPVGLGAILTQKSPNGRETKIISYASRALTPVEQRYSQIEREALAVVYGCEKFHIYVYGQEFHILTDHKPLISMFNHPYSTTPARIERWILRLQQYRVQLIYRPGHDNPADYASRHPRDPAEPCRSSKVAEEYINFISQNAVPVAITMEEVKTATSKDAVLQKVMALISEGKWNSVLNDPSLRPYYMIRDELSVNATGDMVLRGVRLVIPEELQSRAIDIAHESHPGIVKTKANIRTKVWFPNIDALVESKVKSCMPCQANTPRSSTREPLNMTKLPAEPWLECSTDLYGPLPSGQHILVVMDDYSRYPEAIVVPSTSAASIIPRLEEIWSRHGCPAILRSDNGPPYNSKEFSSFLREMGTRHRKITPYWPEANGEAERFMRTMGKFIRAEGRTWNKNLNKFLMSYRETPHTTTGVPPYTALYGRTMRGKLPSLNTTNKTDTCLKKKDAIAKHKMKTYADKRRGTKLQDLKIGDKVLLKNINRRKMEPVYNQKTYVIIKVNGSMITAKSCDHEVTRNTSFFKKIIHDTDEDDDVPDLPGPSPELDNNNNNNTAHREEHIPEARRSQRLRRPPVRLSEYVVNI